MLRRRRSDKHALCSTSRRSSTRCVSPIDGAPTPDTIRCLAKTDYLRQLLRVFSEFADAVHPVHPPDPVGLVGHNGWATSQLRRVFASLRAFIFRAFSLCAPPLAALPFYRDFPLSFPSKFVVSGDRVKCKARSRPRRKSACYNCSLTGRTWKRQGTNKTNLKECRKRRVYSYSCCSIAHFFLITQDISCGIPS